MKVEIEIPDLLELYVSQTDYDVLTAKDIEKMIFDIAVEKFIDKLYDLYLNDNVYDKIQEHVKELVKENSSEIIENVIKRTTDEIIKKKAIVEEMPKKSEVANISKEWEQYFIELIDKAIAKRFR